MRVERRSSMWGGCGGHWGAWIRTRDHGTKTRCLTAWPRPIGPVRRVEYRAGTPLVTAQPRWREANRHAVGRCEPLVRAAPGLSLAADPASVLGKVLGHQVRRGIGGDRGGARQDDDVASPAVALEMHRDPRIRLDVAELRGVRLAVDEEA